MELDPPHNGGPGKCRPREKITGLEQRRINE